MKMKIDANQNLKKFAEAESESESQSLMESTKRQLTIDDKSESKKPKLAEWVHATIGFNTFAPQKLTGRVVLNPADCDLDFNVEGNGLQGSALFDQGFAYCWSGARANVGVISGKYCFSCKIISGQPVDMEDTPFDLQHLCRIGVSKGDQKVGDLGESKLSVGFGGTGKISDSGTFSDYGVKFGTGDTILCAVNICNLELESIGFSVNGNWLGLRRASSWYSPLDGKFPWHLGFFPHVLLKNVVVQLHFSIEDGLVPLEGYRPWASALEDGNAVMGPTLGNLKDCEVIMMVGLPASGKTTWAEKLVKQTPEKRYVVLGTNLALDQMKVPGLLRKNNYGERFDRLMSRATGIFNTLLSRASKTPRNFIIDQTNVYKSARKRKLKPFSNYQKTAVVIFPRPEELKIRAEKRFNEMGKEVPDDAVNEMIANYVLPMSKDMPGTDEYFDQIVFIEQSRAETQIYLDEMKANLNSKSAPSPYPRGNSIQSHNGPSMQNSPECSIKPYDGLSTQYQQSLSVTGGNWQRPHTPNPPLTASYGNHQSSSSSFLPRDDFNHYRSYVGYGSSRNNIEGTISNAGGPTGTYVPCGTGNSYRTDSYRTVNIGSTSYLPTAATGPYQSGMVEPYAKASSFGYNAHGVHGSFPVVPQADPLAPPSQSMFRPTAATGPYQSGMVEPYARTSSFGFNAYGGHSGFPVVPQADPLAPPSQPMFLPTAATGPYQSGMVEPYAKASSFGCNAHGGHSSFPVVPQADPLAPPSQPMFQPATLNTYGPSYGSSIPGPSYGNLPMQFQFTGGYAPPRPGYY